MYLELCTIKLKFNFNFLTFNTCVHAVCSLCAGTKRGTPVSYRYSCIAPSYICVVYVMPNIDIDHSCHVKAMQLV